MQGYILGNIITVKSLHKRAFVKGLNMIFGYIRVSKGEDQNSLLQRQALKAAQVKKIFEEVGSGGRWNRPMLHKMIDQLREGDIVVVWKLDRLSRSLKDLLVIMEHINNVGAGFKSITESIDTTTPAGRMMMQMVGSFAEFEREMIRERTRAGLDAARKEGRVGGRKPKLTNDQRLDILDNVSSNRKSGAQMARLYKISEATVSRILASYRQPMEEKHIVFP
jgi:DNA invertase Pin-like site-specific DNA recombinase